MPTRENYKTLIRIAEKDLKVAKHITTADEIYIEGVCVHCQQCAEKALKAFLDFNKIDYDFIHNLKKLCSDCKKIDNTFSTISTNCVVLNIYSSETRYIDNSEIPIEEMYEAIKLAEEVYIFVKEKIKED